MIEPLYGKHVVRLRRGLRSGKAAARFNAALATHIEAAKAEDKVAVFEDFDVSQNKIPAEQLAELFTILADGGVHIERFRAFGIPTLDDEAASIMAGWLAGVEEENVPYEIHLSDCAITSNGFLELIEALEQNDAFPGIDPKNPSRGKLPLYLRVENNYIDGKDIQEKIDAGVVMACQKKDPLHHSDTVKCRIVVLSHGQGGTGKFQQHEGEPPAPEMAPPPKRVNDKGKGKGKDKGKGKERDRGRDKGKGREKGNGKDRHRGSDRDNGRDWGKDRDSWRDRDNGRDWRKDRDSGRDWGKDRDSGRDWGRDRDSGRDWGRDRDNNRDWGKSRDRDDSWRKDREEVGRWSDKGRGKSRTDDRYSRNDADDRYSNTRSSSDRYAAGRSSSRPWASSATAALPAPASRGRAMPSDRRAEARGSERGGKGGSDRSVPYNAFSGAASQRAPTAKRSFEGRDAEPTAKRAATSATQAGAGASSAAATAKANEGLPYPWEAHFDEKYGLHYYWNSKTGASSWDKPRR
eukprot:TRINITY_DN29449_c0_g4_i1.p1 TRINITY_DN29449_c0_g4~~TRINITY_DN29449_c0_g4_i1.p1  ORF type:complete len:520 (-),score=95.51 TRINITY_DN29449_c0_g4_i1:111-1670(-)